MKTIPVHTRRGSRELTPEVHAIIVETVAKGNYKSTAAACAGIHGSTLHRWLELGQKDLEEEIDSPYSRLCHGVYMASGKAEAEALGQIRQAAEGYEEERHESSFTDESGAAQKSVTTLKKEWQAAAWFLERKHPDRFGRKIANEISSPPGQALVFVVKEALPPDGGEDDSLIDDPHTVTAEIVEQ